jgi:hypothetical protein
MLTFILKQTESPREKLDVVTLTLPNMVSILDNAIDKKKEIEQNVKDKYKCKKS